MRLTPNELAWSLRYWKRYRYAADAAGHEHEPAGRPTGGQFTGKAEHGQSPDDMAARLQTNGDDEEPEDQPETDEVRLSAATNAAAASKEMSEYFADYPDEPMDSSLLNEMLSGADVDKADRPAVIDNLINDGFLDGDDESGFTPGVTLKSFNQARAYIAEVPEGMSDFELTNMIRSSGVPEQTIQDVKDTLYGHGLMTATGDDPNEMVWTIPKEYFQRKQSPHRYSRRHPKGF